MYETSGRDAGMKYMFITNNTRIAQAAARYGVDRIFVDLETMGKEERQKGRKSVKSKHAIKDIVCIRKVLHHSELLVRVNPVYDGSRQEINEVVASGADVIMLPMWKTKKEVEAFIDIVNGRAKTMLLLETKEANEMLDEILRVPGIDEIHVGLNDLHISYGLAFMFELLVNGVVECISAKMKDRNFFFGIGGIARLGSGDVPAELILPEYIRLGSQMGILSRAFYSSPDQEDMSEISAAFEKEIAKLRAYEETVRHWPPKKLAENRRLLTQAIQGVIERQKALG